jgi:uncharacterized protein (DUF1810 family)
MQDPFDLNRFILAQEDDYERAMNEIHNGRKLTHWMWYIFPQLDGLGSSPTALRYAIKGIAEAEAYLKHPILGQRLLAAVGAVFNLKNRSAQEIFGSPDDRKLHSSATLFAAASAGDCDPKSPFEELIDAYFDGQRGDGRIRTDE